MKKLKKALAKGLPDQSAKRGSLDKVLTQRMLLLLIADNEKEENKTYLSDIDIALLLGADLKIVQRELKALRDAGFLKLENEMGPSYWARITPTGITKAAWLKTTPKTNTIH